MRPVLTTRHLTRMFFQSQVLGPLALMLGLSGFGTHRAEARYGYQGSYGAFAGYGAGMGMTLADQMLLKEQIYALNASQIQLAQVQAERESWSAALIREQALSTALHNRKLVADLRGPDGAQPLPAKGPSRRRRGNGPAQVVRRTPPDGDGIAAVAQRDAFNPNIPRP